MVQGTKGGKVDEGPSVQYLSKLLRPVLADVQQLYTDLLYASNTWVNKFLSQEGVTVLLEILKKKKERAKMATRSTFSVSGQDIAICEETIRCLRHLLNFQAGVEAIMKRKDSATVIAACLGMDQGSLTRSIMEFLAALCTVNDGAGHEFVLNGLRNAQRELGETAPFSSLVMMLEDEEYPVENQTACLTLINAIISTADEVHVRMRVRQDFINLGMNNILEKVKQRSEYSNELQSAVSVFEEESSEDKAELSSTPIQHLDATQLTRTLALGVEGTAHQETFMQFLSQLVQLSTSSGAAVWPKLLEHLGKMNQNLQNDALTQQELEGLRKEVNSLQTQNTKLRRELDELREAYSQKVASIEAGGVPPPPPGADGEGGPPPPPGGGPPPPPPPPGGGPPPPPPPPGGGPPPPPPPPGGGPPPPPPPPGGGPPPPPGAPPAPGAPPPPPPGPALPPKKKVQPATKMRQFNWNAVPVAKVVDTFWEKADESKRRIDTKLLEEMFSAKPAPPPAAAVSKTPDKPKKIQIVLLDPKRSNNCSIMLSKFKLSYREIKEAILRLDDSVLDLDTTSYLAQYIPTKEEIDILKDYDGPKEDLAKAEQYFLEIKDVPNLALRLNSWKFKLTFDEQYDEVKEDVSAFLAACKEVKGSHQLHSVLEYVLGIGNYINGGTNRGGVYGFRLETLGKLAEMKSNDGKTTLLHYLTSQIRTASPELAQFPATLSHCAHASKVSLPALQGAIGSMKKDYEILNSQLPNIASTPGSDKFKNVMTPFVEKAGKVVASLETSLKQANEGYVEVCKFYGENEKTLAPEVLFSVISNFAAFFQRIDRELTEKATPKEKKQPATAGAPTEKSPAKTENVDELVEGLKGGDVFKKRRTVRASKMIDADKLKNIIPPEGKDNVEGGTPWGQKLLRPAPQRQSTSPAGPSVPLKESANQSNNPPSPSPVTSAGNNANAAPGPAAGRGIARPPPGRTGLTTSTGKPTGPPPATPSAPSRAPPSTPLPSTPPPSSTTPGPLSPTQGERALSPLRQAPAVPQGALAPVPSRPISALSPRGNPNQKVEVPHCRVLYDFVKEHEGELPLKKGDVVFLRKRLDAMWMEGQLGGQVGAFPVNYVEIIVDLP